MNWTEEKKASAGVKMALELGIEFTGTIHDRTVWLVAFRSPEASHEVRDQIIADGLLESVEVCPNQSWLRIKP